MRPLRGTSEVLVIGGGIIGLASAFELVTRYGVRVTILERDRVGAGTTSKATGGIRTQFSSEINVRLALASRERFEHWSEVYGGDPRFSRIGYLFVTADERQAAMMRSGAAQQQQWGVEVEVVDPREIADIAPGMRVDDLVVGTFTASDGLADPGAAAVALEARCRRAGVVIHEGTPVAEIQVDGERGAATGVVLDNGETISASHVVVACGPWTNLLLEPLGCPVPIAPHRRQVYRTDVLAGWPSRIPLSVDLDTGLYCHSDGGAVVFGGGDRDVAAGFDDVPRPQDVANLVDRLVHRWPRLEAAAVTHTWAGLREMTPDDHGIVGELTGHPHLFVAAGFSGHGFMQAPAVGAIVAALVTGHDVDLDVSALAPDRFGWGASGDKEEHYVF